MIETIIATVVGSSAITTVLNSIFNRKLNKIINTKENDTVLINRIKFLEERVERMEQLSCFDKDCTKRV